MNIKLRKRRTRAGTVTLFLDCYDQGRRWLEYLKLYLTGNRDEDKETLKLAENIRARRQLEYASGEHGFTQQARQKEDFLEFCQKLGESKRSANTRVVWKNALCQLEAFTGGPVSISHVNNTFLQSFKEFLLSRVSQNSAGVYMARIKTACRQAVKDGILPRDPTLGVAIKKQLTKREFLNLEEIKKLAGTPCGNQAVRDAFLFSCFAGLRYSDVRALTWEKVKEANGKMFIEFTQVKTGSLEILPLSEQAALIVKAQAAAKPSSKIKHEIPSNVVFKLPAQQTLDKAIRQWVARAGIDRTISFHCARHTFATLSLTRGIDIFTVSKLLGHSDLGTTQIYAKLIDEKKREAVELLPIL
jgi:integrase